MLEFIPVFILTFLVSLGLILALTFGRAPTYRPTREGVVKLLEQVVSGEADARRWDLFLGMPIQHDEALEGIRVRCVVFHEGLDGQAPASEGLDGQIYDRAGREKISTILEDLRRIIRESPVTIEL